MKSNEKRPPGRAGGRWIRGVRGVTRGGGSPGRLGRAGLGGRYGASAAVRRERRRDGDHVAGLPAVPALVARSAGQDIGRIAPQRLGIGVTQIRARQPDIGQHPFVHAGQHRGVAAVFEGARYRPQPVRQGGEGAGKALVLDVYQTIGLWAVGFGILVIVVSPLIKKLMHLDTLRDADGRLYVTGGPGIYVFDKAGKQLGIIPVPRRAITVTFAGHDRKTLYAGTLGATTPDGQNWQTPQGVRNIAATLYKVPTLAAGVRR